MKTKEIGIWIGVIIALLLTFWGLITLVNNSNPSDTPLPEVKTPKAVSKNDITLGAQNNAKIILTEYADFQCPACTTQAEFIKNLNKDFKDNLLIVYRFLPLDIHKNALPSAQAAFAAFKQNKFWEMSDLLYQNQASWSEADNAQKIFTDYAKALNLNLDQFTLDYNANSTKEFINNERNEGMSLGIVYTPSLFVNGKLIENPKNYDDFKKIIQNEINNK